MICEDLWKQKCGKYYAKTIRKKKGGNAMWTVVVIRSVGNTMWKVVERDVEEILCED